MPRYKAELSSEDPNQIKQALEAVEFIVRTIPEIDDLRVQVSAQEIEPPAPQSLSDLETEWGVE